MYSSPAEAPSKLARVSYVPFVETGMLKDVRRAVEEGCIQTINSMCLLLLANAYSETEYTYIEGKIEFWVVALGACKTRLSTC